MTFDYADKAIRDMNKRNLRAFDGLKLLKFDELNVLRSVSKVYDDSVRIAKLRYLAIAIEAYMAALIECGIAEKKARKRAEQNIDEDWILDMLEDYDLLTLYSFNKETERKKQRTVEAILATHDKNEIVDRALRFWTLQVSQYADNAVVYSTIKAFKDAGIEKVRWVTEKDDRVCHVCHERDGKIYTLSELPPIPHWHCRCVIVPILD